jgi:lysophospholipase L1-like esterase
MVSHTLPLVILIGDSIRIGYQEIVRHALHGIAEVWAPAENGRDSGNVVRHLEAWVPARRPALAHVNCGLHDIRQDAATRVMTTPLDVYTANVRYILRTIQRRTGAALIWATTTPICEDWRNKQPDTRLFEQDLQAYNRAATHVAQELGASINDLYRSIVEAGARRLLLPDGVHFTPDGYKLLGQAVAAGITRRLSAAARGAGRE